MDTYYFKPLYKKLRNLIRLIGQWPEDKINGREFLKYTHSHDDIRLLVAWNFLVPVYLSHAEVFEYEPIVTIGDFEILYKITTQARELSKLALNNISELERAILIFLRADYIPEQRQGMLTVPLVSTINFHALVVLLNKSEYSISTALERLASAGKIRGKILHDENDAVIWSLLAITDKGISSLEGEANMGDTYNVGQAGAVGPGSHAHDMNFNQIWNASSGNINIAQLARELKELRNSLSKEASEPDHYVALGKIASAEKAASEGNGSKALEHLKNFGPWAWDVATKIGIGVAIAAAKAALGL